MKIIGKRASLTIIILAVIFGLIVTGMVHYWRVIETYYEESVRSGMEESSDANRFFIEKEIADKKSTITVISKSYSDINANNLAEYVDTLRKNISSYGFTVMGIAGLDGGGYDTEGHYVDISDKDYFIKSAKGETVISETMESSYDKVSVNVYSCPIVSDTGAIAGVLYAVLPTKEFAISVSNPSFDRKGYSYIVDDKGKLVVSASDKQISNERALFDVLSERSEELAAAVTNIKKAMSGKGQSKGFFLEAAPNYYHFAPLNVNGWVLVTIVPQDVMKTAMHNIMGKTYNLMFLICALLTCLLFLILFMRREKEKFLRKQLLVDEVTGGPSFNKFCLDAEKYLKEDYGKTVILDIDIDGFKLVNNVYGYEAGNDVIKFMYNRIKDNINISYQNEFVAHQGADKFVALLHYYDKTELEKRLRVLFSELSDYSIESKKYPLHPTIGLYDVVEYNQNVKIMIDCASIARKSLKGGYHDAFFSYYDEEVRNQLVKDRRIESEMKDAIRNKEFCVYYQPKYSTIDGSIVGAEALVRWKKPDGSFIMPKDFLPLFETNGFITTLDEYMFKEVCMAQKRWEENGISPVPVSVNLSRLHLYDATFIKEYEKMLRESEVPPRVMQIEVTESAIFENPDVLKEVIKRFHEIGITILMDDFGTGYSSMMMLKDISIDVLKLDKSFVEDIGNDRGEKIINAIIKLAQSLDIEVTAEGVEYREQYEFLRNAGCDNIQGYYFSMPLPEYEYEKLLRKSNENKN